MSSFSGSSGVVGDAQTSACAGTLQGGTSSKTLTIKRDATEPHRAVRQQRVTDVGSCVSSSTPAVPIPAFQPELSGRIGMVPIMSRVIFMCGPSGAGKTAYAKRLEAEGMERLSFDIEMWRRGIRTVPLPPETRADIEHSLRSRLLQFVADGADVVLDFSFWSRQMRDDWRNVLEPTGVVPETIYLATDRATILQRVRDRQGDHSRRLSAADT